MLSGDNERRKNRRNLQPSAHGEDSVIGREVASAMARP